MRARSWMSAAIVVAASFAACSLESIDFADHASGGASTIASGTVASSTSTASTTASVSSAGGASASSASSSVATSSGTSSNASGAGGATSMASSVTTGTEASTVASSSSVASTGSGAGGACTDPADSTALANDGDIAQKLYDCGTQNIGNDSGLKTCIEANLKVVEPCTDCFKSLVDCTITYCASSCATDVHAMICVGCRAKNCDAAFTTCSGRTDS